jgi:hypothetical protein
MEQVKAAVGEAFLARSEAPRTAMVMVRRQQRQIETAPHRMGRRPKPPGKNALAEKTAGTATISPRPPKDKPAVLMMDAFAFDGAFPGSTA